MITEKCTLPIGVEYNGLLHRDVEVGPRQVKHLIVASGDPLFTQNKNSYEVCCLAAQIIKLGDIPTKDITGTLLSEMDVDDFDVLTEAAETVRQRTRTFRRDAGAKQVDDSGADEAGLSSG